MPVARPSPRIAIKSTQTSAVSLSPHRVRLGHLSFWEADCSKPFKIRRLAVKANRRVAREGRDNEKADVVLARHIADRPDSNPAEFFGMKDVTTIAPGMKANLVLLEADPLKNIAITKKISSVIMRGRLYTRIQLDDLLKTSARIASNRK